jgi:hypothetical protein
VQTFFFDVVAAGQRYFDYHGRSLRDAEAAHQHAQILALDSGCTKEWQGGYVEVHDSAGTRLSSVAIVESEELKAAA